MNTDELSNEEFLLATRKKLLRDSVPMKLHFTQEDVDRWQKEDNNYPDPGGVLACSPEAYKEMKESSEAYLTKINCHTQFIPDGFQTIELTISGKIDYDKVKKLQELMYNRVNINDAFGPSKSERDWPEDFSHENGNYQNRCCICKNNFLGHKRRVVCKLCKSKTTFPFANT